MFFELPEAADVRLDKTARLSAGPLDERAFFGCLLRVLLGVVAQFAIQFPAQALHFAFQVGLGLAQGALHIRVAAVELGLGLVQFGSRLAEGFPLHALDLGLHLLQPLLQFFSVKVVVEIEVHVWKRDFEFRHVEL